MSCLTAAQITKIKAEIAKLDELIEAYEDSLLAAAPGSRIKEYRLDTGEGSQKTENLNPRELSKLLEDLRSQRSRLESRLSRTGIVSFNLRRR